jgi:hypothetical protein
MVGPSYNKVHSYILSVSAGVAVNLNYTIRKKSRLNLFLALPICAYVDRPVFLDGSKHQPKFGALNYWNPQIQLTYKYKFSEKISTLINYQYNYLEYSKPKAVYMLGNSISLGIKFKL